MLKSLKTVAMMAFLLIPSMGTAGTLADPLVRSWFGYTLDIVIPISGNDKGFKVFKGGESEIELLSIDPSLTLHDYHVHKSGHAVYITTDKPVYSRVVRIALVTEQGHGRHIRLIKASLKNKEVGVRPDAIGKTIKKTTMVDPRITGTSWSTSNKYVVKKNDTLFGIAKDMSNDSSTFKMRDVALAIYMSNKTAFVNGNINQLLSGVTLVMPSSAVVHALVGKPYPSAKDKAVPVKKKRSPVKKSETRPAGKTPVVMAVAKTEDVVVSMLSKAEGVKKKTPEERNAESREYMKKTMVLDAEVLRYQALNAELIAMKSISDKKVTDIQKEYIAQLEEERNSYQIEANKFKSVIVTMESLLLGKDAEIERRSFIEMTVGLSMGLIMIGMMFVILIMNKRQKAYLNELHMNGIREPKKKVKTAKRKRKKSFSLFSRKSKVDVATTTQSAVPQLDDAPGESLQEILNNNKSDRPHKSESKTFVIDESDFSNDIIGSPNEVLDDGDDVFATTGGQDGDLISR